LFPVYWPGRDFSNVAEGEFFARVVYEVLKSIWQRGKWPSHSKVINSKKTHSSLFGLAMEFLLFPYLFISLVIYGTDLLINSHHRNFVGFYLGNLICLQSSQVGESN